MSIESDFRALLAGHAALTSLVGTRIAQSAVDNEPDYPCVVFDCTQTPIDCIDIARIDTRATIAVQCWAETSLAAGQVADAVVGAIDTAAASHVARLAERSTTFDPELGVDGVVLTVDWWA